MRGALARTDPTRPMTSSPPDARATTLVQARLGTFGGVFTPSILTILGVIMYLRFGWVVGNAGLGGALLIVTVSHLISLATGLSVSSIATNRTVRTGGAYYMISRSLGAPAGAAIGIPLFLGQALSVTFYVVGFTESLEPLFPNLNERLVGACTVVVLTALSLKSAEAAIRVQYVIMGAIGLSLVSMMAGGSPPDDHDVAWFNPSGRPFAEVFAVFFPAVTGIMAGVSMSGDLKDARRSIPRGTLFAILAGFIVYMVVPVWLALTSNTETLVHDKDVVLKTAALPSLVYAGVWGATLSSALGSIMTAPRTLQALAGDGLVPRILGKGYGPTNEPRVGVVFTFGLAMAGVMLGNLDAIAPILTMFFLATYGFTNLACGLEQWAASPSFRPTFRVPMGASLAGAFGCFYVMSVINMPAMLGSMAVCGGIYVVVQRRAANVTWGDARHAIWSGLVRTALHKLRGAEYHPMNWRPNLVILGGNPDKRGYLLQLGSAVVQDRGIVTYFHLLQGRVPALAELRHRLLKDMRAQLVERFPNVFYRVDVVSDLYRGAVGVAQSYGVGTFEANTVMLGWPSQPQNAEGYLQMLRDLVALDRSLLIVRHNPARERGVREDIHVWWGGFKGNGGMMLLMAFLLKAGLKWRRGQVTVLTVVDDEAVRESTEATLREILEGVRLEAKPRVLLRDGRPIQDVIEQESRRCDLAIVGMRMPDEEESAQDFFAHNKALLDRLPTTILVYSARDFEGEPVLLDA